MFFYKWVIYKIVTFCVLVISEGHFSAHVWAIVSQMFYESLILTFCLTSLCQYMVYAACNQIFEVMLVFLKKSNLAFFLADFSFGRAENNKGCFFSCGCPWCCTVIHFWCFVFCVFKVDLLSFYTATALFNLFILNPAEYCDHVYLRLAGNNALGSCFSK